MKDTLLELQKAFTDNEEQFSNYRFRCRDTAQAIREDLADLLGIEAWKVNFVRSEEYDVLNASAPPEVMPRECNDPLDAGQLVEDGWYRIAICFGIPYSGEDATHWLQICPLRLRMHNRSFTVKVEGVDAEFDVGNQACFKARPLTEWLVQRVVEIRKNSFELFLSGARGREMGFHTRLCRNSNN